MARRLPLNTGCPYAIRTAAFLSVEPAGTVFPRRKVRPRIKIPHAFVSKILQALTTAELLHSHRGFRRGYSLARAARPIHLPDAVSAHGGPLGSEGVFCRRPAGSGGRGQAAKKKGE